MLRKAFVDDQLAARQFNTGEAVRKAGLRGFRLSPYVGRVLYSNVNTGVVQVQWPWGAELEFATELVHDVSYHVLPPTYDQAYSTWESAQNINSPDVVEQDEKWRKSLASRILEGYEAHTMPVYRAACEAMHNGLGELEAFSSMASLSSSFGTDAVRRTIANLYGAARRMAIYWVDPKRQYRVTRKEKNAGILNCPYCQTVMKPRKFRQNQRILQCRACGFSISNKDLRYR